MCLIFGTEIAINTQNIMKTLSTILLFLLVSFASAQEGQTIITNNDVEVTTNDVKEVKLNEVIVLSTKGVKKLEDIKIETINKTTYLDLMLSTKKNKDIKIC